MNDRAKRAVRQGATISAGHKNYALALLVVISASNYVDRTALGLLLQDIKADLVLTDTQLGFLTGIAFAIFYSVMGLPIARWADRGDRVRIISIATALWSLMTAACGLVTTFFQLILFRIGVAVGEAGCHPPAYSLMADYFERAERPRAVAIHQLGAPLAALIGYFGAGWLNELFGWRVTFALLGLPGLLLAVMAWFTLKEPRRRQISVQIKAAETPIPSLTQVVSTLWHIRSFVQLLICMSVLFFFIIGTQQWLPSFIIRSYRMETGVLGTWLAIVFGTSGLIGAYLGGQWATTMAARNEVLQLRIAAASIILSGVLSTLAYAVSNVAATLLLVGLGQMALMATSGPIFACIQTLAPERMRAVAVSLGFLFANLIGMGFGPLTTGILSDTFRPWAGDESLRYALLVLSPGFLWAAGHIWLASKTVKEDIERTQIDDARRSFERDQLEQSDARTNVADGAARTFANGV